jgi:hypothetical protein
MIEEFGGGVGVRSRASILDEKTREQAEQTALLPILTEPIALMADAHLGYGATIGSVIPTESAVIPSAVGVDKADRRGDAGPGRSRGDRGRAEFDRQLQGRRTEVRMADRRPHSDISASTMPSSRQDSPCVM